MNLLRKHLLDRFIQGRGSGKYWVTLGFLLILACSSRLVRQRFVDLSSRPSTNQPSLETRKIYAFSVITGGAHNANELALARRVDSVVADHYADFGDSAVIQRMPKDALMYVSYRKANRVYWTKTKRKIPRGETVLQSGTHLARTRCGNRLSLEPQSPTLADHEPEDEALNAPEEPNPSLLAFDNNPSLPDAEFYVPGLPLPSESIAAGPSTSAVSQNVGPLASGVAGSAPAFSSVGPFIGSSASYFPARTGTAAVSYGSSPGLGGGTVNANSDTSSIISTVPEIATSRFFLLAMLLAALSLPLVRRSSGRPFKKYL